jgi:hypothetical protein
MDVNEYSVALMPNGYGYPLFLPSPPDDVLTRWRGGTQVGDVGVLCRDGSFDPIFNICRERGHPANPFGVPSDFVPLSLGPDDIHTEALFHPPGAVISNGFRRKSETYRR